jgi:hypothetical protein
MGWPEKRADCMETQDSTASGVCLQAFILPAFLIRFKIGRGEGADSGTILFLDLMAVNGRSARLAAGEDCSL